MADDAKDGGGELSYEAAVAELESIIDRIESGEIGLEASVEAYERGCELVKRCRAVLERAEQRIEELGERSADDGGEEA